MCRRTRVAGAQNTTWRCLALLIRSVGWSMATGTLHQRCRPGAPPSPPDTAWARTTECRGHTMPSRPRRSSPRRCVSPEGAAAEGGYLNSSFHVTCVAPRHRVSFCAAVHCVMIVSGRSEGSSNSDSVVRRSALKEHPHPNLLPPSSSSPRGSIPEGWRTGRAWDALIVAWKLRMVRFLVRRL